VCVQQAQNGVTVVWLMFRCTTRKVLFSSTNKPLQYELSPIQMYSFALLGAVPPAKKSAWLGQVGQCLSSTPHPNSARLKPAKIQTVVCHPNRAVFCRACCCALSRVADSACCIDGSPPTSCRTRIALVLTLRYKGSLSIFTAWQVRLLQCPHDQTRPDGACPKSR
jgi:hypothetical protein